MENSFLYQETVSLLADACGLLAYLSIAKHTNEQ